MAVLSTVTGGSGTAVQGRSWRSETSILQRITGAGLRSNSVLCSWLMRWLPGQGARA